MAIAVMNLEYCLKAYAFHVFSALFLISSLNHQLGLDKSSHCHAVWCPEDRETVPGEGEKSEFSSYRVGKE